MTDHWKSGDSVGTKGAIFLEEVEPYISSSGTRKRKANFLCGVCKEKTFIAPITRVKNNRAWRCSDCARIKDLTGQKFGYLIVLQLLDKRTSYGGAIWKCRCDCGNIIEVSSANLKQKTTQSCGCIYIQKNKKLIGQKIGKLTVLSFGYKKDNALYWRCKCDCGTITYVSTFHLNSQTILSCGCIKSKGEEKIAQILNNNLITYKKEKTFNDCINPQTNSCLRFDFYLPDYNCCIEYDGEQHFCEARGVWNSLESIKEKDKIKNQYCKNNNIKLIRIPYTDYNILNKEYILDRIKER